MQILFLSLVVVCSIYFLCRRQVDPILVAFGSTVIYFSPGILGSIQFASGYDASGAPLVKYNSNIVAGAYVCMMIVIVAVSVSAMILDRIPARSALHFAGDRYFPYVLGALIIVASTLSIRTVSEFYLCTDKTLTLSKIDNGYYWAAYALPLCLVSACLLRNWMVAALCVLMLGADIFIGFRVNAAICFLSLCVLIGSMLFHSKRSAIGFVAILTLGGGALFVVKQVSYDLKSVYAVDCTIAKDAHGGDKTPVTVWSSRSIEAGDAANADGLKAAQTANSTDLALGERTDAAKAVSNLARAFLTSETYSNSILNSEPFVVQSILNETVKEQFSTGSSYLLDQILTVTPGRTTIFHMDLGKVPLFSELFKDKLFPDVPFGMASNPWAQAYAAGGYTMVTVFAIGYAVAVGFLGYLFMISKGALRATFLVLAMWVAFYFHRNDLMTELGILRQTLYIAILALLVSGGGFAMKLGIERLQNIRQTTKRLPKREA